jgi:hypothetical protein
LTLPTFLGIGVPKAGTTWLYNLLLSHPEAYIPKELKGIRFFNRNYELGTEWYQGFFPPDAEAGDYKAIGEITAHYLYNVNCPERIASQLDQPKLILMLRNPVDRSWSHYRHSVRLSNYQGTFEEFLNDDPGVIRFSHYAEHIRRYWSIIDPDRMLILLSDQVFKDFLSARNEIAQFLELDAGKFPADAGSRVVNKGFIPRYRSVYSIFAKTAEAARDHNIHWPRNLALKLGVKRIISAKGEYQPMKMRPETRQYLLGIFDQEISELETLLQSDLSRWRL